MIRKMTMCALLVSFSFPAFADGIPVEPGEWRMTTTMNMPMLPQPKVTTVSQCLEKDMISAEDMQTEDMPAECDFSVEQVSGTTLRWTVDCPVEGGTSHGEWEATTERDFMHGTGKMTMSFQGQTMEMTMEMKGERVGPCQ